MPGTILYNGHSYIIIFEVTAANYPGPEDIFVVADSNSSLYFAYPELIIGTAHDIYVPGGSGRHDSVYVNGLSLQTGIHRFYLFNHYGSFTSVVVDVRAPVSVPTIAEDKTFSVFPNPANERVYLTQNGNINCLAITDIFGQVICSKVVDSEKTEIDIKSLSPGVYFIQLKGAEGIVTQRFVKTDR